MSEVVQQNAQPAEAQPTQPILDGQQISQADLQKKMEEGNTSAQFRIREKAPGEFVTKKLMHG